MNRRGFFRGAAGAGLVLGGGLPAIGRRLCAAAAGPNLSRVEARHYVKLPDREIECRLCPRFCRLGDKERGYCGVRENVGGTYYSLVYGKVCSLNVDPIEKKPFFHFLPGATALSLATAGCNVNCKFCQNWEISQVRPEQVEAYDLSPEDAAARAAGSGCPAIAYTYTEPTVFFEYMVDTAVRARRRGIRSVVVTGGHINPEPLAELLQVVDAVKVDLKGFTEAFYRSYVRGALKPVLETIRTVAGSKVWLEIVVLVIPTLNDDPATIREMCRWIRSEAGDRVPVHFSRFQPMYLVRNLPPTPVSTLVAAKRIALEEGLRFVYVGNVPGHEAENTFCPGCGREVISRFGFTIKAMRMKKGRCESCGTPIPGIWA
ncbi:MAG TPA: AmmeMemoRadiSam system radical SAM enzyme [Candidatus Aminicenantes bacterium]|nr:AmmeMemoRadiSam system radical SAM enzyme [Candidatus Aminicenantes bacterium]HRY65357.1 AmmeMemoRadiSam system radical SAM enzyme [Candidatus Aminicenantes bacterium]HRZ72175.1 AmmeMemoRadiSam system radical SAM enzyme [Candidatus Aminicenantes bacterium]